MFVIALLLFLSIGSPAHSAAAHKFHVTYSRLAIDGAEAMLRVRFFRDDLEKSLQVASGSDALKMQADARVDSVFTSYFNAHFILTHDGKPLTASIVSSGEEEDAHQPVWWYVMQFATDTPLDRFSVQNTLLFETFSDQKNIFKVMHLPDEKTMTYYFVEGDDASDIAF